MTLWALVAHKKMMKLMPKPDICSCTTPLFGKPLTQLVLLLLVSQISSCCLLVSPPGAKVGLMPKLC